MIIEGYSFRDDELTAIEFQLLREVEAHNNVSATIEFLLSRTAAPVDAGEFWRMPFSRLKLIWNAAAYVAVQATVNAFKSIPQQQPPQSAEDEPEDDVLDSPLIG